jgi:hypothetical protein
VAKVLLVLKEAKVLSAVKAVKVDRVFKVD